MPDDKNQAAESAQKDTAKTESKETVAVVEPAKQTFKVKLEPVKDKEPVTGFAYPDGERYSHWSQEKHGYEMEFDNLATAQTFMTAATDTGALAVAKDSPTKLR